MSLHPAVAAVRLAVRRGLADVPPGATVIVACSGGADSLALLAATVFEARKTAWHVVGATVDHGLQDGLRRAGRAGGRPDGRAGRGGDAERPGQRRGRRARAGGGRAPGAVRRARRGRASAFDAAAVLLGHTRDDQAETVLLGLARGSGGRSLAGMRRAFDHYRRPLLDLSRADTVAACEAEGIEVVVGPAQRGPAVRPVPGPAAGCCRSSRRSSAPAWPRRSPAPPTSSAPTWTSSTQVAESVLDDLRRPAPGRRPRRAAGAGTPARAPAGRPGRRRPGLGALPRARAGDGRPDHRLARPAVDRPPRPAALPAPRGSTCWVSSGLSRRAGHVHVAALVACGRDVAARSSSPGTSRADRAGDACGSGGTCAVSPGH